MCNFSGKEYVSSYSKKVVPARCIKARCTSKLCQKNLMCFQITDEQRREVFEKFNGIGDLHLQREFLARHIKVDKTRRKTTDKEHSRRGHTLSYTLTVENKSCRVCKIFFLNTLGVSERMCRTAISKIDEVGVLEKERRGGRRRSETIKKQEKKMNSDIEGHINRFPRVESHYCRAKTTRMYLHPDLSLRKMFEMFLQELKLKGDNKIPSYSLYRKVFKRQKLSFFSPKKDQCSLCVTYLGGDVNTKAELKERYNTHISEKISVREKKKICKEQAKQNSSILCGVFDMQQVIYVPISKESSIFYKSRLSNFNLTFYNLASKECYCFVWNESVSKRGSSEIASCLFKVLEEYSRKQNVTTIDLFADGCYAQNKNSIIATMLLYSLHKFSSIEKISLKYFETNHGQSEGDSAHSAISSALSIAGDIFVPSQLQPVINLARRKQPYKVISMNYDDFKDFKTLSTDLRVLSVRETGSGSKINWTNVMEIMVEKSSPMNIFFKNSHLQSEFDSICLKRLKVNNINSFELRNLNKEPNKISLQKYNDLVSLCSGTTPVIKEPEFKTYYRNLPHQTSDK